MPVEILNLGKKDVLGSFSIMVHYSVWSWTNSNKAFRI